MVQPISARKQLAGSTWKTAREVALNQWAPPFAHKFPSGRQVRDKKNQHHISKASGLDSDQHVVSFRDWLAYLVRMGRSDSGRPALVEIGLNEVLRRQCGLEMTQQIRNFEETISSLSDAIGREWAASMGISLRRCRNTQSAMCASYPNARGHSVSLQASDGMQQAAMMQQDDTKSDALGTSTWVGRSEELADLIHVSPAIRLALLLGHDPKKLEDGKDLPPLAHWLYFQPRHGRDAYDAAGQLRRGGVLPQIDGLPHRMWAGGRLSFPGSLTIGMPAQRRSIVTAVTRKEGRSGPLVFVTLRHEMASHSGGLAVIEEHDFVYRGPRTGSAAPLAPLGDSVWRREVSLDVVTLFQYSALTFNSYRIHYDPDYAIREEHYSGAVVHGPLLATLLIDLVLRNCPGCRVEAFSFRSLTPLFAGDVISLNAKPDSLGRRIRLWAAGEHRGLAMEAEATLAVS